MIPDQLKVKPYRIAIVLSRPIQHFSPFLRELTKHPQIELTVYYCSDESLKGMMDINFGTYIKWDIPLLDGYKYKFLKNQSPIPTIFRPPFGLINIGIISEIVKNRYDAIVMHGWNYVTQWIEVIRNEIQTLREENEQAHREILSAIKFSYAELDQRIRVLERDVQSLSTRLDRLEARQ